MKHLLFSISSFLLLGLTSIRVYAQSNNSKDWKAGVARVVITPERSQWMSGYSDRNRPSENKIMDVGQVIGHTR
jgi:neutral ceramidase